MERRMLLKKSARFTLRIVRELFADDRVATGDRRSPRQSRFQTIREARKAQGAIDPKRCPLNAPSWAMSLENASACARPRRCLARTGLQRFARRSSSVHPEAGFVPAVCEAGGLTPPTTPS